MNMDYMDVYYMDEENINISESTKITLITMNDCMEGTYDSRSPDTEETVSSFMTIRVSIIIYYFCLFSFTHQHELFSSI